MRWQMLNGLGAHCISRHVSKVDIYSYSVRADTTNEQSIQIVVKKTYSSIDINNAMSRWKKSASRVEISENTGLCNGIVHRPKNRTKKKKI